jgi:lipoprotein NlpI
MRSLLGSLLLTSLAAAVFAAEDDPVRQAREALARKKVDEALSILNQAIERDPKQPKALLLRGAIYEGLQEHAKAIADFDRVIALDSKAAEAYNRRGSERFKLGKVNESLTDFDKFLELQPQEKPGHWKRGISLYYAGKFDEGRQQFEGYEKVDTNDVENAVWHFLCVARASGVEKARASLLKIGKDKRVPMSEVYELFAAKLKPEDVLAAVQEGKPGPEELNQRLFYAHLYLGLYYEVSGDRKLALKHLTQAEEHRIGHYMWDVAHVHADMLRKQKKD